MIGKELHRGLEREDITSLIEAHDWIAGLASRDCDCRWNGEATQLDNPCDVCQARRALDALAQVIDPRPRTLHPGRLKNDAERVFYELWCAENERHRHLNGGFTLIEHLLCPESSPRDAFGNQRPSPVTQHDMTIATSIIQWLGTSCGLCFMQKAESEIEKRRAERIKFNTNGIGQTPKSWDQREDSPYYSVADSIAAQFVSVEKHGSVYRALRSAIYSALCECSNQPATPPSSP